MVEATTGTSPTPRASTRVRNLVIAIVGGVAITLAAAIGGSYFVGINAGHAAAYQAIHSSQAAAKKAAAANKTAQEGRSRALCSALRELALTHAAHKLHPIFQTVYEHTGCVAITGDVRHG